MTQISWDKFHTTSLYQQTDYASELAKLDLLKYLVTTAYRQTDYTGELTKIDVLKYHVTVAIQYTEPAASSNRSTQNVNILG